MKKFVIKVLTFFIVIGILPTVISYLVDPFNVFHALEIRDNGVEPNKNFVKMTYILNNPDKFDTFVFGSSRVGNIHVNNMWGFKAYNMTYSECLPSEILANMKTFVKNGIYPKHIFVGVDSLSYTIDPQKHMSPSNAPYELSVENPIQFYSYYLDLAVSVSSLKTIFENHKEDDYYAYRFYEFGWNSDYGNHSSTYDFENAEPSIGLDYRLEETLSEIKELVDLCNNNNIEITIFTNPLYYVTYNESLNRNYIEFLRGLSEITEFCNFSGINYITSRPEYWIDNSHYTAETSDLMIDIMCYHGYYEWFQNEGFGYWVNKDNFDEFLEIINRSASIYATK